LEDFSLNHLLLPLQLLHKIPGAEADLKVIEYDVFSLPTLTSLLKPLTAEIY